MGVSVMSKKSNVINLFPDVDCLKEVEMLATLIEQDGEVGFLVYMTTIMNHLSGYVCTEEKDLFDSAFRMMMAVRLAEDSYDEDEIH